MWFEATHHNHHPHQQHQKQHNNCIKQQYYSTNPDGDIAASVGITKVPSISCISNWTTNGWGAHGLLKRGLRRWGSTGSWVCNNAHTQMLIIGFFVNVIVLKQIIKPSKNDKCVTII